MYLSIIQLVLNSRLFDHFRVSFLRSLFIFPKFLDGLFYLSRDIVQKISQVIIILFGVNIRHSILSRGAFNDS